MKDMFDKIYYLYLEKSFKLEFFINKDSILHIKTWNKNETFHNNHFYCYLYKNGE